MKPEAGTMPYSYLLQGFFIVHSTIGSTVNSMPLNSLDHCVCTTTMTNIRPDRNSNLVLPGYKPQSIRMSHRGRLQESEYYSDSTKRRFNDFDLSGLKILFVSDFRPTLSKHVRHKFILWIHVMDEL